MNARSSLGVSLAALPLLALTACGGSSAPAPEPVLLSQFNAQTDRFGVVSTVGKPEGTIVREGRNCDIYKIYTSGLTAGGRAAMKAGEVVTSIATLGLAQVIWAPIKAGTRPQLHTVLFCFGRNDRLVDLYDKDPTDSGGPDHIILNKEAYGQPVVAAVSATPEASGVVASSSQASGDPAPITVAPHIAGASVDHVTTDARTGQETIYEKQATPMASASAGSIGLGNVSREAVAGTTRVKTGAVVIPANATADDLNSLSGQKAAQANHAALGAKAAYQDLPSATPVNNTTPTNEGLSVAPTNG